MADPDTPPPSSGPPASEPPERDPAGEAEVGARIRQQRQHIEGLDGRDPLRPGIDD